MPKKKAKKRRHTKRKAVKKRKSHKTSSHKKKKKKTTKRRSKGLNFSSIKKRIRKAVLEQGAGSYEKVTRCSTGIPGLDEAMEGGYEIGSSNLVVGGAGAGKTIFATQFIIDGIEKYNEPGIYISFEEDKERFYKHMTRFGWDLKMMEKKKKFLFIENSPEILDRMVREGGGFIESAIEKVKAKRIVFDSISAFVILFDTESAKREALLNIFRLFNKLGCTILVTGEYNPPVGDSFLEFEVDGVLYIYNKRKGDIRERSLEVYKMRGTKHASKIFPLKIGDSGIVVFPKEPIF